MHDLRSPSTATFSASRSPSSPARAPARCRRASRATSAGCRTSSPPRPPRSSPTYHGDRERHRHVHPRLAPGGLLARPPALLHRPHPPGGGRAQRITTTRQETIADMFEHRSGVPARSPGILLGKTMGRSDALADRFHAESARLAELEVRQRMAGRWVMASIQTSFAVMPAAAYWFAGTALGRRSRSPIGTRRGVHHPPVRLFRPIMSLLSVQIDVQTALALFDRIFEYLDLPVEIAERPSRGARSRDAARRGRLRGRHLPLRRRRAPDDRRTSPLDCPRGHHDRDRRRDRLRQDHARLPRRPPLRRRVGRG